jgi:hypothetical protein
MATETLKYLLNPCWLTELGAARWFERTLVCCARGWLRPKRQWCTGLHSEAWAKIQSTHCNATPGRIRILQRTTFSLYWNRPRSSHSISRAYHCKMWEKGGGMSCRGFSAFARMTVGMMMVVFGNTSRSKHTSSILVASWVSTALHLATVMEHIHLSSTPYTCGSFRVKRRMLLPASRD